MEKWREGARFVQMYEPHETIELDGLGRELPGALERSGRNGRPGGARSDEAGGPRNGAPGATRNVPDGPVFVDESGRRSRKYRRIGWILGLASSCYAVLLAVTVVGGNSSAPWLLIPGPASGKKAGTVKEPSAHPASSTPAGAAPGAATVPGPVDVVSTGDPRPRTTISSGVRVTLPPAAGRHPAVAAPGTSAPAGRTPSGGAVSGPSPVSSPVGGGSESPPASPGPDPSASASGVPPEQSAPPAAAPAPQQRKAHHTR